MSDGSKGTTAKMANTKKVVPVAEQQEKPKSKLTWKERLAELPEEEAAELRTKANEASKKSKAKKRRTPEAMTARVQWLEAKLVKVEEKQVVLNAERQAVGEDLEAARAGLAQIEEESGDGDDE